MPRPRHFLADLAKAPDGAWRLAIDGVPHPLAARVETAFDSESRKRGLLGRLSMDAGLALIIAPCSAVHTFGMRMPIDVIFAARDGRVLAVRRGVRPGRVAARIGAFAAIEMAAGSADRSGLRTGRRLAIVSAPPEGDASSR